jgi:SAM-dependent methyltransferase
MDDKCPSQALSKYYEQCFVAHGPSARGVDWPTEAGAALRYDRMSRLILDDPHPLATASPRVLDAGCGYAGLLDYFNAISLAVSFTGVDLSTPSIEMARRRHPDSDFMLQSFLDLPKDATFDYIVCNGALTQKRNLATEEMAAYVEETVTTLYPHCERGLCFNLMTSKVNFESETLFYKNPGEMLSFCLDNLTPKVRLDHSYDLYEYTVYCYRPPDGGNIR